MPSPGETYTVVAVRELRAHATGLPYLKYLLAPSQRAVVLAREGCCSVRVPTPERFALHKLIVSRLRASRGSKAEKDVFQAAVLSAVLGERHPRALEEGANSVPPSARKHMKAALRAARALLEDEHPRAWEALTAALA